MVSLAANTAFRGPDCAAACRWRCWPTCCGPESPFSVVCDQLRRDRGDLVAEALAARRADRIAGQALSSTSTGPAASAPRRSAMKSAPTPPVETPSLPAVKVTLTPALSAMARSRLKSRSTMAMPGSDAFLRQGSRMLELIAPTSSAFGIAQQHGSAIVELLLGGALRLHRWTPPRRRRAALAASGDARRHGVPMRVGRRLENGAEERLVLSLRRRCGKAPAGKRCRHRQQSTSSTSSSSTSWGARLSTPR